MPRKTQTPTACDMEEARINKEARECAEEMLDLIREAAQALPDKGQPRYWETLQRLLNTLRPATSAPPNDLRNMPMTHAEAREFEQRTTPWGKHAGKRIGEVPCGYWLAVSDLDPFRRELSRYVRSEYFQHRQDEEGLYTEEEE